MVPMFSAPEQTPPHRTLLSTPVTDPPGHPFFCLQNRAKPRPALVQSLIPKVLSPSCLPSS
jgi:hypothetical protein